MILQGVSCKSVASSCAWSVESLKLSNKRAQKVKRELIRLGVPAYKIDAFGYGENHLLPDSDQGNRRVVVNVR